MKKVLIVTYYWPPSGGSGVQRWLKFAKYLPEFGWEPVVYTVENGEFPVIDKSLEKEIPAGLTVIKKPIWEPFNLYKKFTGQKKDEKFGHGFAEENKEGGGLKSVMKNFAVWVRGNFFIPDARKFWIKPSVKFLKQYLRENKIDHVITTGPPHSLHLIGLQLKRDLKIKWVADFRDPWTGVYYFKDLKLSESSFRKHRRLENAVLLNADKVVSVGFNLEKNLSTLAGEEKMRGRTEIITNGYDVKPEEIRPDHPKEFSLVYTGLFSKDQNHEALWNALGELVYEEEDFKRELKIKCYGKIDSSVIESAEANGLKEHFTKHDYVPLSEIGKIQRGAAVLLLCINHYPGEKEMLTGKLFDYICSGRPVLNVGPTDGDAAAIIEETNTGKTFDRLDKEGIKKYILDCFKKYKRGELFIQPRNLENYSRKNLTKKLSLVLNSI